MTHVADHSAAVRLGPSQATAGDYIALLKPRVMSLVVFTAITGMVMAPGHLHPTLAVIAILCIAVGAGASGALNMWYDADIDAGMERTRKRPIPAGAVQPGEAFAFGMTLAAGSVLLLGLMVNYVAAALLAFTIFFYVVIYTMWLKRSTPQNIVIGGAAGALPPVIGWAAVTGSVSLESLVLFLIIFLWTPPHFWALALYKSDEYAKVGVPMLPVVAGEKMTRLQILLYALILLPVGVLPAVMGFASLWYGAAAALLGLGMAYSAFNVFRRKGEGTSAERRLFLVSLLYLFLIFALLLADSIIGRVLA
jgi:protoheme IX farnesyltransferase